MAWEKYRLRQGIIILSIRWQAIKQINLNSIPKQLRDCLLDTGSLTRHLEKYCEGKFSLDLKSQSWRRPLHDEVNVLNLRTGEYALIREIYFKCNDKPWVYGRSIIPAKTLRGAQRRLAYWGQRSLGLYLFSEQKTFRGQMEIAKIFPADKLFQFASNTNPDFRKALWGRRSVFYIKDKPLLIVEIFLPDVITCINI